jgi:hypothetical protein
MARSGQGGRGVGQPVELVLHASDFSGSLLHDRKAPVAIRALVELARAFLHAYENPDSLTRARLRELAPLVDVLLKQNCPDDVQALWVYALSVFEPHSPLHEMITTAISKPAKEMYMTLKDELLTRGRKLGEARGRKLGEARGEKLGEARGRKLGEAIGEARGRAIGKAQAVLEVLEHRGIPVSASVRKRILAMRDELALPQWIERAVTVTRAAELFEPASRGRKGSGGPSSRQRAHGSTVDPRAA